MNKVIRTEYDALWDMAEKIVSASKERLKQIQEKCSHKNSYSLNRDDQHLTCCDCGATNGYSGHGKYAGWKVSNLYGPRLVSRIPKKPENDPNWDATRKAP